MILCIYESEVLLLTSAEDLDCTPGFQQKVFHIDQPAEFIEDQAILNCKQSHSTVLLAYSLMFKNVPQHTGFPKLRVF
ncbi:hypothetical protein FD755_006705 [Muntiacus reevesi]|uniref:Cadherin prodomain domain-containing protein n=2 Tax=Muntiacus TaxID=9885 RepID=A0A5J5MX04_MUNRE|nr:hypothetical protein FD754_015907 [Muntiacus muntjak]KAB0384788.1 hypothetical protein FD755_006705 [Muntiacus reevesi]